MAFIQVGKNQGSVGLCLLLSFSLLKSANVELLRSFEASSSSIKMNSCLSARHGAGF